jgi:allophanate hydrolase
MPGTRQSLDLTRLAEAYASGTLTPADVVDDVLGRIAERGEDPVWITRAPEAEVRRRAAELTSLSPAERRVLPLYGIPFAVKDNVDVAGLPTTAACPAFAYTPERSARTVERLEAAGAVCLGKTNLDQFATGLAGVRSPYGVPENPFDPACIPGGSSSGSAVAVSAGLCSFALGTDTAGSGRVPASFNNIVGIKPTRGMVPCTGVVPDLPLARLRLGAGAHRRGCLRSPRCGGRRRSGRSLRPRRRPASAARWLPPPRRRATQGRSPLLRRR